MGANLQNLTTWETIMKNREARRQAGKPVFDPESCPKKTDTWETVLKNRDARRQAGNTVEEPEVEELEIDGEKTGPSPEEIRIEKERKEREAQEFKLMYGTDYEAPLPPGYTCRSDRETEFLSNEHSTGIDGLCWSVLLLAVQDGCNPKWLSELIEFYQITVDPRIVYRHPVSKTVVKNKRGKITRGDDIRAPIRRTRTMDPCVKNLAIPESLVKAAVEQQIKPKTSEVEQKTNILK